MSPRPRANLQYYPSLRLTEHSPSAVRGLFSILRSVRPMLPVRHGAADHGPEARALECDGPSWSWGALGRRLPEHYVSRGTICFLWEVDSQVKGSKAKSRRRVARSFLLPL